MIESFVYFSEKFKELSAYQIDYSILEPSRPISQSELYRSINEANEDQNIPYVLRKNDIIFLSNVEDLGRNTRFFLLQMKEHQSFNEEENKINIEANQVVLSLERDSMLVRKLLRESLINQILGKGRIFRDRYGLSILLEIDGHKEFKWERKLSFNISHQLVSNALQFSVDVKHSCTPLPTRGSFDHEQFRNYTLLKSDERYKKIKDGLTNFFGDVDEIVIEILGNKAFTMNRMVV